MVRFKGKESEVLNSVKVIGVNATLEAYGIKHRRNFLKWLRSATSEGFYSSPIQALNGGAKAQWLREHRDFVLECIETFGQDFIQDNLGLSENTLDDFLRFDRTPHKAQGDRYMDKLASRELIETQERQQIEIQRLREACFENKRELAELKALYSQFVDTVSGKIGAGLIKALVRSIAETDLNLTPRANPLALSDLNELKECGNGYKRDPRPGMLQG